MNDQILPDEPTPEAPAAAPAQPAAPDLNTQRLDRLEQVMAELNNTVRQTGQQLLSQQTANTPPPKAEDFLNELATDPRGVIQREARAAFQAAAGETLTPAVLQVLDTSSRQLLSEQELKVDTQFGIGTWNELFRPQLEKDLTTLRAQNPSATADRGTLDALVSRLYGGDNFDKLADKRRAMENAMARGMAHHMIPGGGIPRLRSPNTDDVPNDVEQFNRDVERATGQGVDRKVFNKLYYTGVESGPGRHRTDVVEYLKAVGAKPDKIRMHGGGGTGQ